MLYIYMFILHMNKNYITKHNARQAFVNICYSIPFTYTTMYVYTINILKHTYMHLYGNTFMFEILDKFH